jgi:hypothetical protein
MLHSAKLCSHTAEHGVVRVAGVASLFRRYAMILEMRGCQMPGIINLKASSVRLDDVARKAESSALGMLKLRCAAHPHAQNWQREKNKEGHHLAAARGRNSGTNHEDRYKNHGQSDQQDNQNCRQRPLLNIRQAGHFRFYFARLRM